MQTRTNNDSKPHNQTHTGTLSWLYSKAASFMKYPIEHPYLTLYYTLLFTTSYLSASKIYKNQEAYKDLFGIKPVKQPIDGLLTTYQGPSYLHKYELTFDPKLDLAGWTSDRHAACYIDLDDKEDSRQCLTSSFHLANFPKEKQDKLIEQQSKIYQWSLYESDFSGGFENLLSHRAIQASNAQTTFGFYGYSSIEKMFKYDQEKVGFIVGIRAFGNEAFYSHTSDNTVHYQLAKIDLGNIDVQQVNPGGQHNDDNGIAHVYVKGDKWRHHPDMSKLNMGSCKKTWTRECYDTFIKNLPNFTSAVDWVIPAADVTKALTGEPVNNLMNNEKINIVEWHKEQVKRSLAPIERYGIFTLARPTDYPASRERNEHTRDLEMKAPLVFKIGKN